MFTLPTTKQQNNLTHYDLPDDVVVSVDNVSKKFCKHLRRSMAYGIADLSKNLFGIKPDTTELRKDEFWAIENVSFELKRGETLGLIGVNGSGKTTLLRLLSGILPPDKGKVIVKGKVGALIAIGSGFHPHMTGKENIYLNGTILGMTRDEIDSKFQDIVDFAEIHDFLNAPVSTYSSGMRVRLGFSIAAHIEPDLLLIDEVLSVGDVGFRAKCFNAIHNTMQKAAVILVSHSMPQVSRVCTDVMTLKEGRTGYLGKDVPRGIDIYYSYFNRKENFIIGGNKARVIETSLECNGHYGIDSINYLDELIVHIRAKVDLDVKRPNFVITIYNQELQIIVQCSSFYNQVDIKNTGREIAVSANLGKINLNPGHYVLEVAITREKHGEILIKHMGIANFQVRGFYIGYAPVQIQARWFQN